MKLFFTIVIFSTACIQLSIAQSKERILGKWTNEDNSQIVRVQKSNDVYVGKLINLKTEETGILLDKENDIEEKRNRKLVGIDVWLNFEYDEERMLWKNGEIYNYKNGNTYNGKIQVEDNELRLTGHYGFFFFLAKTQKWTRVLE